MANRATARSTRRDTFRVSLVVGGVDFGVWDSKSGGKIDSDSLTFKPGGMGPQKSLGGTKSIDIVTLERNYTLEDDHDRLQTLINGVGKAKCVVKQLPLDVDGNAYGSRPLVYNGSLKSVTPPDHDSTSTDAAMIQVEIAVDGDPTL